MTGGSTSVSWVATAGALGFWSALALCGSAAGGLAASLETVPGTAGAAASPESSVPVAVAARVERTGSGTQLVFDLSRPATVQSYVLENPDRIVLESSEVNFQIPPDVGRASVPGGLIRSFRFGHFASGKSRIVIDLSGPAKLQKIGVASIAGGDASRLEIQLVRCERSAFHESADRSGPPAAAPPASAATALDVLADSRPVIVLDPGHGGVDPGASGIGGVVEKRVVYDFATVLADKLKASGRYKVVMTRAGDSFVSLGDRVKIARDAKASLFVSLHADTLAHGADVTGATVYTVSDKASDAEAARVADTENKADEVAGVDSAADAGDVSDILFDLTRRETRTFSHAYQHTLAGYWQKIARLNRNPERSAGFKVLQAPDVPSVLLELGYLSNDKDVAALNSSDWRGKAADSIAASIDSFFAARHPAEQADNTGLALKASVAGETAAVVIQPHL